MWGPGDGVDDKQQDDDGVVVVGYAFMAKKMDSMSKVGVRAFSTPPNGTHALGTEHFDLRLTYFYGSEREKKHLVRARLKFAFLSEEGCVRHKFQ